MQSPKVSVIVPVYNAEAYIERCAHSLFGQTLDEIEYIFIDDCTPDDSIVILKQELEQYHQDNTASITHGKSLKLIEKYGLENFCRLEEFASRQNNENLMRVLDFFLSEKSGPCYGHGMDGNIAILMPGANFGLNHISPEFSKSEKIIYPLIARSPF